jgi:hypothetical protein
MSLVLHVSRIVTLLVTMVVPGHTSLGQCRLVSDEQSAVRADAAERALHAADSRPARRPQSGNDTALLLHLDRNVGSFVIGHSPSAADGTPGPTSSRVRDPEHPKSAVIFDTDMGSDCDDAGALAVLHALADAQEVRVLGVIFSSGKNRYGVGTCDAINTYYGRGDLPLGQYQGTDVGDPADSYTRRIATAVDRFGHDTVDQAPDLVSVYCQILESQPDHSVTIITVGHPHGLVHLMRDRRAASLVRAKVDRWVAMGMGGWNFQRMGMSGYVDELLQR